MKALIIVYDLDKGLGDDKRLYFVEGTMEEIDKKDGEVLRQWIDEEYASYIKDWNYEDRGNPPSQADYEAELCEATTEIIPFLNDIIFKQL